MSISSYPIFIACDHGGIELKKQILENFLEQKFIDLGTDTSDSVDYPEFAQKLCQMIPEKPAESPIEASGILICGSGQGMAIAANRFKHIRAALCWNTEIAELSRKHNNANVLCLGGRFLQQKLAFEIIRTFYSSPFEGGRHENRVGKI